MNDLLICLFSYNSENLLNCIRSIDEFAPQSDRIVIDDASSNPSTKHALEVASRKEGWKVETPFKGEKQNRYYGNYYRNMAYALKLAVDRGYKHCLFMEDDQQYVCSFADQIDYLDEVFARAPDCIIVQPLFFRRILQYRNSLQYIANVQAYRLNRGFTTTGFWNLEAVRQNPDYELIYENGDDLPANSLYWMKKGFFVYCQRFPTIAVIPWRRARDGQPDDEVSNRFSLEPLSQIQLSSLTKLPPERLPYQEYFVRKVGQRSGLVWHRYQNGVDRFLQLCRQLVREENSSGASPEIIPVLEQWQPRVSDISNHSHSNYRAGSGTGEGQETISFVTKLGNWTCAKFAILKSRFGLDVFGYIAFLRLSRRLQNELENLKEKA